MPVMSVNRSSENDLEVLGGGGGGCVLEAHVMSWTDGTTRNITLKWSLDSSLAQQE